MPEKVYTNREVQSAVQVQGTGVKMRVSNSIQITLVGEYALTRPIKLTPRHIGLLLTFSKVFLGSSGYHGTTIKVFK